MYLNFIYPSVNGHLGCFHVSVLWIMLQCTWEWRCLLKVVISYPLDIYLEVGLLDHMVVLFLVFWGASILFSIVTALIYIPTNSAQRFLFLYILTNICYLCHNGLSNRCEVMSCCGFDLQFPVDHYCQAYLIYLLASCMSSLEKFLFRSFVHFLLFAFLLVSCMSFLYILDINL